MDSEHKIELGKLLLLLSAIRSESITEERNIITQVVIERIRSSEHKLPLAYGFPTLASPMLPSGASGRSFARRLAKPQWVLQNLVSFIIVI